MCKLCDRGSLQNHYFASRRDFLKGTAAIGATTAGLSLFAARPASADDDDAPEGAGRPGRRYVIRGGSVMSMDPKVGDFVQADVLVEGKKILAVGANLGAGDAGVIDARGRIVMPGFIDTHHHQFETVLRSFLADGVLINDGSGTPSLARPSPWGTFTSYPLPAFLAHSAPGHGLPLRLRRHHDRSTPDSCQLPATPKSAASGHGRPCRARRRRDRFTQ